MTRTFTTIAALAFICLSAPAFAHGSGHGGMDMGGNGHNGPSMNSMNSMNSTSWSKVDNKSTQTTSHHHDSFTKFKQMWQQQQVMRLQADWRRLEREAKNTTNPTRLARIRMEIATIIVKLRNDGAL